MRWMKKLVVLMGIFIIGVLPSVKAEEVKEATVAGTIVDEAGQALIAQVVFYNDASLMRLNTDLLGRYSTKLPLGDYTMEVSKGSEYEIKDVTVSVEDRRAKYIEPVVLKQLYETDWLSGDLHQHTLSSFDGSDSPANVLLSNLAVGLDFGFVTDHNDMRANAEFTAQPFEDFLAFAGTEVTTDLGHFNALNFNKYLDFDVPNGEADLEPMFNQIQSDDAALLQVNHPLRDNFKFEDMEMIERFDLIEVWNGKALPPYVEGDSNEQTKLYWFDLLNEGIFIPMTAGSDNHDIQGNRMFLTDEGEQTEAEYFFNRRMYSGSPRTVVYAEDKGQEDVLEGLEEGHSFVTNNPLIYLSVEGAMVGETVEAGELTVEVDMQSNRELEEMRLYLNGEVVERQAVEVLEFQQVFLMDLEAGDWVVLEVLGASGDYALTNPVFIK
ncbi:CehA/McbA family metallohydrolase [Fundicoccus culcitae]|uniref:CehA/McbA family metallohydrolase n=1 Tax=Fundicoccus culcitae TaxID=2969821 RepID=A0ABY5P8S7_9LACT|nr:CehA/McbA family metallohydrolase [Fundicoccus culcitae]UUX35151.1 CehA/McbA family metallohydrolase [Fundicoccus culcitae]